MMIGAMNHPQRDAVKEIEQMAEMGLEFLDLTLEPPAAASWQVNPGKIRSALADHNMAVVGHTAYYLPLGSSFDSVREAAVNELRQCLEIFAEVGAPWMNIHPDRYAPMQSRAFVIQRNLESLQELQEEANRLGVGLMIENLPGHFNSVDQLGDLLDPLPDLGLHLDIAHANLMTPSNTTQAILGAYGNRLRHVHLSDNKGGRDDLHLPLGAGTIDVARQLKFLKLSGYDATITLEVFSHDQRYLAHSRDTLRRLWDEN